MTPGLRSLRMHVDVRAGDVDVAAQDELASLRVQLAAHAASRVRKSSLAA